MKAMDKELKRQGYNRIRTMDDLHYHQRLLSSRIDHQEVMVMYRVRSLWDFLSPTKLLNLGCEALASHNKSFNIFYRTATFFSGLFHGKKK